MKKQLVMGLATAMAFTMSGVSAFAATTGDKEVPVTYDNRNIIPDPENPGETAQWGVSVPTAIVFTVTAKTKMADVELMGINGGKLSDLSDTFEVEVKTKSKNGMKLYLDAAGKDDVAYTLAYGGTSLTGTTESKIATLMKTPDKAKQAGTATLTGTATKLGSHIDTLTYTIENTVK